MKKWFLLASAIAAEVTGSMAMKAAQDDPRWFGLVVLGYGAALILLAAVLRAGMTLSVAYGIWGAIGVALTALLASVIFHEAITVAMGAGIVLIIAGVLLVELGSHHGTADRTEGAEARA